MSALGIICLAVLFFMLWIAALRWILRVNHICDKLDMLIFEVQKKAVQPETKGIDRAF